MFDAPPAFLTDLAGSPPTPPGGWGAWLIGAAVLVAAILVAGLFALRRAVRGSDRPVQHDRRPARGEPVRGELVAGGAPTVDARPHYDRSGKPGGRDPSPPGLPPGQERRLRQVRAVADFLDNSLKIPGIGYPIGWDAVIGLVPGVGDAATGALAVWIVGQARALGVPKRTLLRMLGNAGIDLASGTLPGVGDLLDMAFKANRRNLRLIEEHLAEPPRKIA